MRPFLLAAPAGLATAFAAPAALLPDPIRGVNIGGWLVLEPWITPLLFEAQGSGPGAPVDEYTLTQRLGKHAANHTLHHHWDTFYTEHDFQAIAAAGLNTVRIPVGYWLFAQRPDDPYVAGAEPYLDRALGWCRTHHLQAWVDLHGVPGLQNGFDNSGLRDHYGFFSDPLNTEIAATVLQYLATKYGPAGVFLDVVSAVQLVNEPLAVRFGHERLARFYARVVDTLPAGSRIAIHDGFEGPGLWNQWAALVAGRVVSTVDYHYYHWTSRGDMAQDTTTRVHGVCGHGRRLRAAAQGPSVVGEFSAAITDCTPWLRGYLRGSVYDGSDGGLPPLGSCVGVDDVAGWGPQAIEAHRRFLEAQMDAWEHGSRGWIYWCYKLETPTEWDWSRLLARGVVPQPLTLRQYPNQCGYGC